MWPIAKLLCILAVFSSQVSGRISPYITNFIKEQNFLDKRIILTSSPHIVTENDSFSYVICDSQEKTFKLNHCNVTVETPAFLNATYKDTCSITLQPNNPKIEFLAKLKLHLFGDDKVLLSWFVKDEDYRTKIAVIRILHSTSCNFIDIQPPAVEIDAIVSHDSSFDVIFSNKTLCIKSEVCKITYDAEGKKLQGPLTFLPNVKYSRLDAVIPASLPYLANVHSPPIKGPNHVFVLTGKGTDYYKALHVGPDGKVSEFLTTDITDHVKISTAHGMYGVCWTTERTKITCKQYDSMKTSIKTSTTLKFEDHPGFGRVRWLQPHNLQEGGMLLVTGQAVGEHERRFESFSIYKIHTNGKYERPLVIEGIAYECTSISSFYVNVSENDEDEICIHFVCDRGDFDRNGGIKSTLKLGMTCFSKRYASMIKHKASIVN